MMQQPLNMGAEMKVDRRRNGKYQPGQLLTSVAMDQEALECFYCCRTCPFCCCKKELAEATFMDIYANGAIIGKPMFCCCCSNTQTSIGNFHHYDDMIVFNDTAVKGEMCGPYPFCCVNHCDCFGEVLVMRGKCCTGASIFALGNQCNVPSWCPLLACCMPISIMYGLAPGEANRVAAVINGATASFRNGQWPAEGRLAAAMSGQQYQHVVGYVQQPIAVVVQQQPMGQEQYTPKAV